MKPVQDFDSSQGNSQDHNNSLTTPQMLEALLYMTNYGKEAPNTSFTPIDIPQTPAKEPEYVSTYDVDKANTVEPYPIEHLLELHEKAIATKDHDLINNIIRDVNIQMVDLARRGEDLTVTLFDIEEHLTSQIRTSFNKSGYDTYSDSDVCTITITVPKGSQCSYQQE